MMPRLKDYVPARKEKQCWRCERWMSEAGFKNHDERCLKRAIESDNRKRGVVMIGEFHADDVPFHSNVYAKLQAASKS